MNDDTNKLKGSSQKRFARFVKWLWILFGIGWLVVLLIFVFASWGLFGYMPTFEELENPQSDLAAEVISIDGKTLGKFYLNENRTPVDYKDLPEHLVQALIATEDERYFQHSGIDARGTLRALILMGKGGGASTITQQLAKLLFTKQRSQSKAGRLLQKIKEWVIAIRLESQYTKEEIIAMYLNKYDFLYQAVGIRSAARIYFGKEPQELNIQESAVLVAMLKNPIYYNPRKEEYQQNSLNRRNQVLVQMLRNGYVSEYQKDSLVAIPLVLDFSPEEHSDGVATYFREHIRGVMRKWIKAHPKKDGTYYDLYREGLKIYTTIDSRMQAHAEEAMKEHMANLQKEFFHQNTKERNPTAPFLELDEEEIKAILGRAMRQSERWRRMKANGKTEEEIRKSFFTKTPMKVFNWRGDKDTVMTPMDSIRYYKYFLQSGFMAMEPQTGHVKVWVGGYNFKHFQYDHVAQGRRQVGSTFKPFVYATAIDQLHLSPCDSLPDVLHCIEAGKFGNSEAWCPKNSGDQYGGYRTLKNALANSVNTITATLMDRVGPGPVVNLAREMGITSPDLIPVPAIGLGSTEISLYEMVGAYSTFANQGVYVEPVFLTRIEDHNGTVLDEFTPTTKDVLSEESSYVTINLLEGVTQGGSGVRLRHQSAESDVFKEIITGYPYSFENPIAGKTGTTQNQSDGWFMGMVPNLVAGAWVGGEDRSIHFSSIGYGQGASMALPIWGLFMKKCYADENLKVSKDQFPRPQNLSIEIDCRKLREANKDRSDFSIQEEDPDDYGF